VTSSNALYGDLTAAYKIGKWQLGPVGYFAVQTSDTGASCEFAGSAYRQNAIDGLAFWTRIGFKIWGFWGTGTEAPLVSKN
jgi:hypothetical protein